MVSIFFISLLFLFLKFGKKGKSGKSEDFFLDNITRYTFELFTHVFFSTLDFLKTLEQSRKIVRISSFQ